MFGVKWKLIVGWTLSFLILHVKTTSSGSQKKKISFETNSRHHLSTTNENPSSKKLEGKDNLLKLSENTKNSPKNKIIKKSSKHELVINTKSQNGEKQLRRNKFKHPHRKYSRKYDPGESYKYVHI